MVQFTLLVFSRESNPISRSGDCIHYIYNCFAALFDLQLFMSRATTLSAASSTKDECRLRSAQRPFRLKYIKSGLINRWPREEELSDRFFLMAHACFVRIYCRLERALYFPEWVEILTVIQWVWVLIFLLFCWSIYQQIIDSVFSILK